MPAPFYATHGWVPFLCVFLPGLVGLSSSNTVALAIKLTTSTSPASPFSSICRIGCRFSVRPYLPWINLSRALFLPVCVSSAPVGSCRWPMPTVLLLPCSSRLVCRSIGTPSLLPPTATDVISSLLWVKTVCPLVLLVYGVWPFGSPVWGFILAGTWLCLGASCFDRRCVELLPSRRLGLVARFRPPAVCSCLVTPPC